MSSPQALPESEAPSGAEAHSEQPVFQVDQTTIDAQTAWDLRPVLVQALYTQGPVLWVDLRRVTFIDSTGLGMLVGVLKEARQMNGDLHLINAGREVRRLLDVTGLRVLFDRPSGPNVAL